MAYYFAKVSSNNTVDLVVKIGSQNCVNYFGEVSEVVGAEHCAEKYGAGPGERWIRTVKDATLRGKYAGIGDEYDADNDRFLPPRPHGAWTFNSTTYQYEAPITQPDLTDEERDAGKYYSWDDNSYIEDNTTGWILEGGN